MNFFIIGIDDNREQDFTQKVKRIIANNKVFSGGIRHREIMTPYLPKNHKWIDVVVPLDTVFKQFAQEEQIVFFASGDPLFYGFANTVLRRLPEANVKVYPNFNSLQLLAHGLSLPYHDMHVVSLTGRPWVKFDEAIINGEELIGVLTDKKLHTPSEIAKRMLTFAYDNYEVYVGELLGNKEKECISHLSLKEVAEKTFAYPNNLILKKKTSRKRPFGIPESEFHLLDGRVNMLTKMPIRLLSLSYLELRERNVLWDIGFCTGSVSVEAKLQFPHLDIVAFEKRPNCKEIIDRNCIKFGTPGIRTFMGDFVDLDLPKCVSAPDAVFIGGHGGRMNEIIEKLSLHLSPDGIIVFNSVSENSRELFLNAIETHNLVLVQETRISVDEHNPISVLKAKRKGTITPASNND